MNAEVYSAIFGDFGPLVALIIVITFSILAIMKFGVNFNLNDFLASRKERHRSLARMSCPHMIIIPHNDNEFEIRSLLYSPHGTLNWVCRQCGAVIPIPPSDDEFADKAKYFIAHPDVYEKRMKKYMKHAKKSL